MKTRVCGGVVCAQAAKRRTRKGRTLIRMRKVYDFAAMSGTLHETERQRPIFTVPRLLGGLAFFAAGFLFLLSRACFDVPIETSVDLEHKGVPVLTTIEFRHPEQGYAYGFAFRPSFVKGPDWLYREGFEAEEKQAWTELSPTVDIAITDSSGVIRMRDISRISREAGWTITNGSHQDRPASVYKFLTFKPVAGERYQVRVYVIRGCVGSSALSPVFFIEMPTSGL
jgi:hypothetical protein